MSYFDMFVASFAMVFLMGLQSKNVNQSRYLAAALTSMGILGTQFLFTKIAAHGGLHEFLAIGIGGAAGVTASIWVHDTLREFARKQRTSNDEKPIIDSIGR